MISNKELDSIVSAFQKDFENAPEVLKKVDIPTVKQSVAKKQPYSRMS